MTHLGALLADGDLEALTGDGRSTQCRHESAGAPIADRVRVRWGVRMLFLWKPVGLIEGPFHFISLARWSAGRGSAHSADDSGAGLRLRPLGGRSCTAPQASSATRRRSPPDARPTPDAARCPRPVVVPCPRLRPGYSSEVTAVALHRRRGGGRSPAVARSGGSPEARLRGRCRSTPAAVASTVPRSWVHVIPAEPGHLRPSGSPAGGLTADSVYDLGTSTSASWNKDTAASPSRRCLRDRNSR